MSDSTTTKLPDRKLLEAHHEFPGPYMFKIILPASPNIEDTIQQAIRQHLTSPDRTKTSKRSSASGKHDSITLTIHAASVDEVLSVYTVLGTFPGIKALF